MELWHVLNRGVDKRNITSDDHDRRRFVRDLYEMNDLRHVNNLWYTANEPFSDVRRRYKDERERLVDLHGWCLMGNHYHLLVSERIDNGISLFLKKLNGGYAKYFNERHNRSGALFQGRTKKVLIEQDAHFLWILHYIHFNPLDFLKSAGDWRKQRLVNSVQARAWLEQYRWSSCRDYLGKGEFSPIMTGSFMYEERDTYMKEARRFLSTISKAPFSSDTFE